MDDSDTNSILLPKIHSQQKTISGGTLMTNKSEKTENETVEKKEVQPLNQENERKYREPELVVDEFLLKNKSIDSQKNNIRKSLGMAVSKQKNKKYNFYRNLKVKLYKAGVEIEPELFVKKLMFFSIVLLCVLIFTVGFLALINQVNWLTIILILIGSWFVGFAIIYYLLLLLSMAFLDYKSFKRNKEVEKVLPEYLRLVATNYRSGLPLDKALTASNRPRFGILSKEIEQVAKITRVKGDLIRALEIFGRKFDSKILERSMNSISLSVKSGSNISQLLDEIANNITKMRNIQASMAANVKNYVIFIIVAGIIIAPLMFAMSYQMNHTISQVKEKLDVQTSGVSMGTISVQSGGGVNLQNFDIFAILMILTNCVISSMVISIIKYGNFQQGIKNIFIYAIISVSLYIIGKGILSTIINVL
jgi:pilus assembly protein TadC